MNWILAVVCIVIGCALVLGIQYLQRKGII